MGTRIVLIALLPASFLVATTLSASEPVYYVSTEHMNVTYISLKYFEFFRATAARPGRWDPKYYVYFHVRSLKTLHNNMTVEALFYEFRSNEYRRGFVEMRFQFCDLVQKDYFFGPALRANLPVCPLPPGEYHLNNMSIPDLPILRTFPFRKGRIYASLTDAGNLIAKGYIDMEIKMKPFRIAKTKSRNSMIVNKT